VSDCEEVDMLDETKMRALANNVLNIHIAVAKRLIENSGAVCRIISDDGMQFGCSAEYVSHRINVEVIDNIVVYSYVG
jgi:hypothetical protein